MALDSLTDRMARLWSTHGDSLHDTLQAQALFNLLLVVGVFLITVEVLSRLLAQQMAGPNPASPAQHGWTAALVLVLAVLIARLASASEWAALWGHPDWMLADQALAGWDAAPGGPYVSPDLPRLQEAAHEALSGLASQSLLLSLLACGWALWILHPAIRRQGTGPGMLGVNAAIIVLFLFAPTIFVPIHWAAAFGHPEAYAERLLAPQHAGSVSSTPPVGTD